MDEFRPDLVDFRAYQTIDLYKDTNAYHRDGSFGAIDIAAERTIDGNIIATTEGSNRYEYVLGTKGRSGEQWDIWQAVFSPAGDDGYPKPIYDKRTGVIDKDVAKYWHDNYDLDAKMVREWPTLGPKLEGKVHVAVGESDTYFLNNAVHLMQDEMDKTQNPHSDATFDYGPRQPHCQLPATEGELRDDAADDQPARAAEDGGAHVVDRSGWGGRDELALLNVRG